MLSCKVRTNRATSMQVKSSKKLIGMDDKSNVANFKYTNLVEICPLCKDDLLYLPKKVARNLGNISRTVLVKNITDLVHVIDPLSGQTASMNPDQFWRQPIRPIITAARSRLTRYIVLGKEPVVVERNVSRKTATRKNRNRLAAVTVAKESDLGVNDQHIEERSHVGYLMKAGDVCLGYDLTETQFVDDDAEESRSEGKLPDVILVRKLYGGAASGEVNPSKTRIWSIRRLDVEVSEDLKSSRAKKDAEMDDVDEEDFMREVEADKEMRKNMNVYKSDFVKKKTTDAEMADDDGEGADDEEDEDDQQVKLDELLDGLALDAGPDGDQDVGFDEDRPWGVASFAEGEKAAKDGISYLGRDYAQQVKDKEAATLVTSGTFSKADLQKKFDI